jgi:hypothetical protein
MTNISINQLRIKIPTNPTNTTINYNIIKLKNKLASLEKPEIKVRYPEDKRIELIKITTEKFKQFLQLKHDLDEYEKLNKY